MISLSVFFPAYNEEENIESSVRRAEEVLKTITNEYEVIIVNDGSTDATGAIADRLAAESPNVRVIHHSPNQGYGAALASGFHAAHYDYVFFTDADLQFDLGELPKLTAFLPEHEVVLGYRAVRKDRFMRIVNAKLWNIANRILFGLKVKDIDCAFKVFKRQLVSYLPLESGGAMLSAELLIRLQRERVVFKEVPVTHLPRVAGSPTGANPKVILRAVREMWQLYQTELGNRAYTQLLKFGFIGVVNTLLDLGIYLALTRGVPYFAGHLLAAKAVSFSIGTLSSFAFNRYWTFEKRGIIRVVEIVRFYITALSSVIINVGATYLFLRFFHLYDVVAVIAATLITFGWNFVLSKQWVFLDYPITREKKLKTVKV